MHLSYHPDLSLPQVTLSTEESLHLTRVLRLKAGDNIKVTDGAGTMAKGLIQSAAKKNAVIQIQEKETQSANPYFLTLAVAPTKSMDKFEFILEKCTELGVKDFIPLFTHHSERRNLNVERCNKIVLSAVKQSRKAWLPEVKTPMKFNEFLNYSSSWKNKLLAHCDEDFSRQVVKNHCTAEPTVLCIGPEGDFSKEEIQLAEKSDFKGVSLGTERLRTETAALFATSVYHTITRL